MKSFFLVWSPSGQRPPAHRHETQDAATKEAERLAGEHAPAEFFVLEAVSVSQKPTVTTRSLELAGDRDIPF